MADRAIISVRAGTAASSADVEDSGVTVTGRTPAGTIVAGDASALTALEGHQPPAHRRPGDRHRRGARGARFTRQELRSVVIG